jgi:MFS-type transporter involved in bile tolerance (Atg22 family)
MIMEDKQIPFIAHEQMMVRMERTNHRLWILCIFLIICLIASNVAWIVYESQWEVFEEQTVTQESSDGVNNFIGNDGDIYNGEADNTN